jgi:hypothetical protein
MRREWKDTRKDICVETNVQVHFGVNCRPLCSQTPRCNQTKYHPTVSSVHTFCANHLIPGQLFFLSLPLQGSISCLPRSSAARSGSPQIMQYPPTKSKEYHASHPKDPFILPCPSLNHANRVPTHTERIGNSVEPLLSALQDLLVPTQIPQYCLATGEILV